MKYKTFGTTVVSLLLLVSALAWGEGIWETPWLPIGGMLLHDVHFVDPQQGWAVGTSVDVGFIGHKDGDDWKTQFQDVKFHPEAVQFLTDTKGWVAGWREIGDEKTEGVTLSTEDGGEHWSERHQFPWRISKMPDQ